MANYIARERRIIEDLVTVEKTIYTCAMRNEMIRFTFNARTSVYSVAWSWCEEAVVECIVA